ncbi:MAG: restriction endonuclease subunit S [Paludibacteraceae bacterium]|nr:restriction endonuclease subunit S [Paludibacteraceae bacterium]
MEWKKVKIGDVCRIKHGFAFKGIHFVDTPQKYVCVTPGNFTTKGGFKNDKPKFYNGPIPEDYILKEDDLIVTMTDLSKAGDSLGYSALVPHDDRYIFLHNQRIGLVTDISKDIDKHFLYWVMRTFGYQKYIVNHCSGSTVKHTSPSSICSYNFECPTISYQKLIAKILDDLDAKIENNTRINRNLEAQAQALFKSWFVDFEPWGGVMPEDWKEYELGEFLPVITGKKDANIASKTGKYPFFSCAQDILYTDNYSFDANAILVAGNGDFNVKWYRGKFEAYQRTYVLIPNNSRYLGWLFYMVKHNLNNITCGARGSVIKFITKGNLENFRFAAPMDLTHCDIIDKFNTINQTIENNCLESARLAALRDTLLPKLMKGEIEV